MKAVYQADLQQAKLSLAGAKAVLYEADAALGVGAQFIARDAVRFAPKAEGTLLGNIRASRVAVLQWQVESSAATAEIVEKGTGLLGNPPRIPDARLLPNSAIAALALWIQRKGITPRGKVTPEELPWLIARKIAGRGTKAQPYMKPAYDANQSRVQSLVSAAINKGLAAAGFTVMP